MSEKLSARWIAALRSGKYKQGTGRLRTQSEEFCCLGVLCDIIDPTKWKKDPFHDYGYKTAISDDEYSPDFLTTDELSGMDLDSKFVELIKLNDTKGYSFRRISNVIEEDTELCKILDSLDLTRLDYEVKSE